MASPLFFKEKCRGGHLLNVNPKRGQFTMKKFPKRLLKITGVLALIALIGFFVLYLVYNKPLPESQKGPAADVLAEKMLTAINHDDYKQTRFLEWTFAGGAHKYKWDKENGKVEVKWDDYTVNLNLNDTGRGLVFENGKQLSAKEVRDITNTALDYFNNDSFWLVAPFKAFDTGTERSIVKLEDGSDGLLVTYTSGGTTPGDSYLWKLNSNGFPENFQMWTQIIPIGGIEVTWDDWKVMENGLFLPATHEIGPMTLDMGDVKAYN